MIRVTGFRVGEGSSYEFVFCLVSFWVLVWGGGGGKYSERSAHGALLMVTRLGL